MVCSFVLRPSFFGLGPHDMEISNKSKDLCCVAESRHKPSIQQMPRLSYGLIPGQLP